MFEINNRMHQLKHIVHKELVFIKKSLQYCYMEDFYLTEKNKIIDLSIFLTAGQHGFSKFKASC